MVSTKSGIQLAPDADHLRRNLRRLRDLDTSRTGNSLRHVSKKAQRLDNATESHPPMAFDFPLENSELVSISVESVLYGACVPTPTVCFNSSAFKLLLRQMGHLQCSSNADLFETNFPGVYVVLFASCVQVVFRRRRGGKVADRKLLAITALSLFVFITWVSCTLR